MQTLTDLSTIRDLCDRYGFSFSKHLGQNFIINPAICPKICETAGITQQMNVLEIGPGFGTLTKELSLRAKKVVSLEVDKRLLPVLQETLAGCDNVKVVNQDVLTCNLEELIRQEFEGSVLVCANLPYYITSPVIMKILEQRLPIQSMTVMVQKEAAQRIAATPGTRACGAVSYAVHYFSDPVLNFGVKPGSFYPPPKVTSEVLTLQVKKNVQLEDMPKRQQRLFRLIRASFSQRRKTLCNAASAGLALPKKDLQEALSGCDIQPMARPEQLTLEQYICLEHALWPIE